MTMTDERIEMPAADAAQALRVRLVAGDSSVSAAALAAAEAEERVERLRADAKAEAAGVSAEREAEERLRAERTAVQDEWAKLHDPARQAELSGRLDEAVAGVSAWMSAVMDERREWDDLGARAAAVGFDVGDRLPAHLRSLFAQLGKAILAEARTIVPYNETTTPLDQRTTIWES